MINHCVINKSCNRVIYIHSFYCWHFFVVKVDRDKQIIVVDEYLEDVSIADLQELLPGHQPRYIVYTYRMVHDDSRVSHPMCFIFYTPRDSHVSRSRVNF